MYLLIALSVLAGGVTLERLLFFRARQVDTAGVLARLRPLLRDGAQDEAQALASRLPGMEGQVTTACLASLDQGPGAVEEAMLAALAQARLEYDRNLAVLGTLGNNAPFIGLFGTVLGIIKAFVDLAQDVGGGAAAVMAGISEALVATAIGLLVALPAVVAFNVFRGKVKEVLSGADVMARTVLGHAHTTPAAGEQGARAVEEPAEAPDEEPEEEAEEEPDAQEAPA